MFVKKKEAILALAVAFASVPASSGQYNYVGTEGGVCPAGAVHFRYVNKCRSQHKCSVSLPRADVAFLFFS